jgi:murein DD-endopeptidase MepM/ murein hydrolase activator NlpD
MRILLLSLAVLADVASGIDVAATLVADGFDFPVGRPNGNGYHRSRGFRAYGHLGDDWNGNGGGDTDLGDPVYAIANGVVVFAQNFGHGWGNVVIVRHVYEERGGQKFVDSLYGHLDRIGVRFGQMLKRGAVLGTIGTGGGLYPAHLHLELRKDIRVGMARHRFPHDDQVYWDPFQFINARRRLRVSSATAMVPMNTFVGFDSAEGGEVVVEKGFRLPTFPVGVLTMPVRKQEWKPDRYQDLKNPNGLR